MEVAQLGLQDFRNYREARLELSSGLNLVIGRNAQGKTNLLEAVYCLSGLGSPRSADSALVRQGAERALLHGTVVKGSRRVEIDLELRPGRGTKALVNKTRVSGIKGLSELCVSVFFGPDELSLVKGSPDGRRRFLDDLVVKVRPAQEAVRREWERVLRQRNALLKSLGRGVRPGPNDTLEVWDEAFCRAGAALGAARLSALARLRPYAAKRYADIAGRGALGLSYVSTWIPEEYRESVVAGAEDPGEADLVRFLRARLDEVRPGELERRVSLAGPGRDDILVSLGNGDDGSMLEARSFASQGDQRTAALALKLGEHDLLSDVLGEEPILLLDDVFSELDPSRRGWLKEAVAGVGQTLLSSADSGP
ncbi:MAG: replication and repair protein RecF, partial [Actinomycetota bacterium]|nr:replication and repair protein RecF [Actinomycetota bacterium]